MRHTTNAGAICGAFVCNVKSDTTVNSKKPLPRRRHDKQGHGGDEYCRESRQKGQFSPYTERHDIENCVVAEVQRRGHRQQEGLDERPSLRNALRRLQKLGEKGEHPFLPAFEERQREETSEGGLELA